MCTFSVYKFDVSLHLKSVSLMHTYIKRTPHFLENLEKSWIYSNNLDFIQKICVFSQTNDVYSANISIIFKKKNTVCKCFLSKECLVNHFFPSTNL